MCWCVSWLQLFFLGHDSSYVCLGWLTATRLVPRAGGGAAGCAHQAFCSSQSLGSQQQALGQAVAFPRWKVQMSSSNPAHHQCCFLSGRLRGDAGRGLQCSRDETIGLHAAVWGQCVWVLTFRKVEVRRPSRRQLQSSHFPDRLPRAQRGAATGAGHTAKPGTLCKGVSCVGFLVPIPGPANAVWTKPTAGPAKDKKAGKQPGPLGLQVRWAAPTTGLPRTLLLLLSVLT